MEVEELHHPSLVEVVDQGVEVAVHPYHYHHPSSCSVVMDQVDLEVVVENLLSLEVSMLVVMGQVVVVEVEQLLHPSSMVPTSWVVEDLVEVDLEEESFLSVVEVLPEYYARNRHRNRSEKHYCLGASEN